MNLNFEVGDVLDLNIENEKIISLNLNSVSNLLSISMNLTLIDVLKFSISIKQDRACAN